MGYLADRWKNIAQWRVDVEATNKAAVRKIEGEIRKMERT
jgi:hypothetical protein